MARHLTDMAALFQALGDETRLRILGLLLSGEVCVCDIHESLKIPQSKASRHLAYLRKTGLVDTRREGLWVHYKLASITNPVVAEVAAAVRHALTHDDVVQKDGSRLETRTGCCAPASDPHPTASCCAPEAALVPVAAVRRRR